MRKALGMIEFKTVSAGITATDQMLKASEVELIEAQTVCPGKYISLISGELSAIKAAIESAQNVRPEELIDSFILGNPSESIFEAIYGTTPIEKVRALGILETYNAAAIIEATDIAVKTAIVELIELRIAKGMCGKSYMFITGEIASCEAAIQKAKACVGEKGMFLDSSVIAHPDEKLFQAIL